VAYSVENLLIEENQPVRAAIQAIDANKKGMCLVVEESGKLIGVVSDGDIRRAIMSGVGVEAPVEQIMTRQLLSVMEPLNQDHVVKLIRESGMHRRPASLIPSVNELGRPVSLYHVSELLWSEGTNGHKLDAIEEGQKILLLGGAGYIGSILTRMLLAAGYKVTILDKFLYGDYPIREIRDHPNLTIIKGDTRHINVLVPAIKDAAAVIHLAELVGDPLCAEDPQTTFEINYLATANVSRICSDLQVNRYIYMSSCSVYGASTNPEVELTEDSELAPTSIYARMKLNAEKAILKLGEENPNFSPCIFRLGTVFGMSHRPRFDLVVNVLTAKAVKEGRLTVFGGDQWRPNVHAADIAAGIKLALEAPLEKVRNQIFNVATENMRIIDIGNLVCELVPGAEMVVEGNAVDRRNYNVSSRKIRDVLGWEPRMRVKDGIREIVEALRNGWVKDYADPKHHNYNSQFMTARDIVAVSPYLEREVRTMQQALQDRARRDRARAAVYMQSTSFTSNQSLVEMPS
jgi:nucleoside-diphosphate-sugar epimerase